MHCRWTSALRKCLSVQRDPLYSGKAIESGGDGHYWAILDGRRASLVTEVSMINIVSPVVGVSPFVWFSLFVGVSLVVGIR